MQYKLDFKLKFLGILILTTFFFFACKKEQPAQPYDPYSGTFHTLYFSWQGQKFVIYAYDSITNNHSVHHLVNANDTMNFVDGSYVICRNTTAYYAVMLEHTGGGFRLDPPFPFGGTLMPLTSTINVSDTFSFYTIRDSSVSFDIHSRRIQ